MIEFCRGLAELNFSDVGKCSVRMLSLVMGSSLGMPVCTCVHQNVPKCARARRGVPVCARVCMGVLGCIYKVGVVGCGRVWWGVLGCAPFEFSGF